jgi:hypothetical protein
MGSWEKARGCFNKKLQILGEIAANTETQCHFIQDRKMKGLKRVLKEREALLKELVAVNEELAGDQTWKSRQNLAIVIQEIADKQQEIMERSKQVLQQAVAEKARIAEELRQSKIRRQVNSRYVNPYAVMARGRRINEKG